MLASVPAAPSRHAPGSAPLRVTPAAPVHGGPSTQGGDAGLAPSAPGEGGCGGCVGSR